MKVYAHCLIWNDEDYLPKLYESLERQTMKDFAFRALDNGTTDGGAKWIQKHYPNTLVARNAKNKGFAPGHNQLLQFTMDHLDKEEADPYVLLVNSDMILDERVIEVLSRYLDDHPEVAGVQPKLLRAFNRVDEGGGKDEPVLSDVIDTTGLRMKRNWRMVDRGAGELDRGQFDNEEGRDLIAPTGTMAMYRLSVVKDLLIHGEWFDGGFFAYREDCDFALRFKKAGYIAHFVPEAKAWHFRGMFGEERMGMVKRFLNRRGQSPFTAGLSTRNQILLLLKHLGVLDILRYGWWIVPAEMLRVGYGILFEPMTRRLLIGSFGLMKRAVADRREIREKTVIGRSELYAYVGK